jgi:[ribosomal protein S18]-alanine N-acetyltransferase
MTTMSTGAEATQREPAALTGLLRRAMAVRDLDAVLAAEVRAYSHPWSHGNFVDSLAAGYLAEAWYLDDAHGHSALAGYFIAMPGVDELHLLNLTVAPDWQGRGLGHALLDAVQAIGRERGLATLWLEVRESNARARALYRRRGFAEVALRRGYYPASGRREDAVVMSIALHVGAADAVD